MHGIIPIFLLLSYRLFQIFKKEPRLHALLAAHTRGLSRKSATHTLHSGTLCVVALLYFSLWIFSTCPRESSGSGAGVGAAHVSDRLPLSRSKK